MCWSFEKFGGHNFYFGKRHGGSCCYCDYPNPVRGMGEIQLKSVTGSLSRPAAFYVPQEVAAPRGSEVLIIELKERVCYVIPYEGSLKI